MDHAAARRKAVEFARSAYFAKVEVFAREAEERIANLRRGPRSGHATAAIAKVKAEQVLASITARLDSVMEGYQLYEVPVNDGLARQILADLHELHAALLASVRQSIVNRAFDIGIGGPSVFMGEFERQTSFSMNRYKAEIERKRLTRREGPAVTNIYHLQGHNPHVNINSQDGSVNSVMLTSEQVFQDLRSAIMALPDRGERQEIIARLDALEAVRDSPSFKERYTAFISAAANHITLVAPFIPALTEMLHKVL